MVIRWAGVEMPIVNAFPNLLLILIFVSTSVGLASAARPMTNKWLLTFCALLILGLLTFGPQLQIYALSLNSSGPPLILALLVLGILLAHVSIGFINIGRVLGREFGTLPALQAYSVNLIGSILGVCTFALFSTFWCPPALWVAGAAVLVFLLARGPMVAIVGLCATVLCSYAYISDTWTPYSKITIVALKELDNTVLSTGNYRLAANNYFFHGALRIIPRKLHRQHGGEFRNYDISWPYRGSLDLSYTASPRFDRMLILGGGSGNDVAAALNHSPKSVDVVEIDPFIAQCGFTRHPNKPYGDPKVRMHVTDARSFLRYSPEKFDVIKFAFLDPGATTRLSSFLRIDNFVYTKESIQSALNHLSPDGVVELAMASGAKSPITRRLYQMITEVNGKPPIAYLEKDWDNIYFLFGPGVKPLNSKQMEEGNFRNWPVADEGTFERPATDDWPFLYLFPAPNTVLMYFVIICVAALAPLLLLRGVASESKLRLGLLPMLFLGAAFMLMETKGVTKLSLLFGATWIVNSVVFFTVLVLAFIANLIVLKFKMKQVVIPFIGLLVALILDFYFVVPAQTQMSMLELSALSAVVTCLPVLFGSIIFSILLGRSADPVRAMGANALGLAFGGLLENISMFSGIKSLSLVALVCYGLAGLFVFISARKKSDAEPAPEILPTA